MSDLKWVRELSPAEQVLAEHARTGDLLDDGSVLLRQEDMNRMGLNALRDWIHRRVVDENATIAVGAPHPSPLQPILEEIS
jgi:hypothetical protein